MLFSLKNLKKSEKKSEGKEKTSDGFKKNLKMEAFKDDFDFGDSPVHKPNSQGSRRQDSGLDLISDFNSDIPDHPVPPPRTRKNAGWSDGTPGKKSWLRKGSINFLKDSPKKEIVSDTSPVTEDIPVIPDLDTLKDQELSADVAEAPSLAVSRIATYQELDSDLSKHTAFQSLDGIDLSLLTKRLLPEHVVAKDDDAPWTWDTLFADVSSQINAARPQSASLEQPR